MTQKILDYTIGIHKLAEIPLDKLFIDAMYQRDLGEHDVDRIAREYEPHLFEPLTVNRRKDGTYAVIDGQHRLAAARRLGLGTVVCRVIEVGPKDEALRFIELNRLRRWLPPVKAFKAELAAEVPICVEINKILAERGFRVADADGRGRIGCVMAMKRVYGRGGWVGLGRALDAICLAWPDDEPGRFQANVLLGMDAYLCRAKGDIDLNALGAKLSKVTARRLLAGANQRWHSWKGLGEKASMVDAVASEIERMHRRKVVAA